MKALTLTEEQMNKFHILFIQDENIYGRNYQAINISSAINDFIDGKPGSDPVPCGIIKNQNTEDILAVYRVDSNGRCS